MAMIRIRAQYEGARLARPGIGAMLSALASVLLVAFSWAGRQDSQAVTLPPVPAYRAAENVSIITIQGPIDRVTAMSVQRRIAAAERAGADALVIELDTPGGEVGAVLDICTAIESSSITNTVAWIRHDAYSGGAIIAMACREIVVSSNARFGDAKVVGFSPFHGMIQPGDVEKEKIYPVLFERIDAFTKRHNEAMGAYSRDELLSQAIIADDAELWWVRDRTTGVHFAIDRAEFERLYPDAPVLQPQLASATVGSVAPGIQPGQQTGDAPADSSEFTPASPDVRRFQSNIEQQIALSDERFSRRPVIDFSDPQRYELVAKLLSGRGAVVIGSADMARFGFAANTDATGEHLIPINTDEELKAFFQASNLYRMDESWSESFVRFMTSLPVQGLLVVVFLLGLFIEMTSPGMVLPGAVAMIALVGLIVPPFMIGAADWWAVAAIIAGIALILLELFVFPGFGVSGALGLFALLVGLLGIFIGPSDPQFPGVEQRGPDLLYGVVTLLISGGVSIAGMIVVAKNFGRLPIVSNLILRSEHDPDQPTLLSAMATHPPTTIGRTGRTLTTLRPAGRIELDADATGAGGGELLDVVSGSGYIDAAALVRIVAVDGFRIVVEPVTKT